MCSIQNPLVTLHIIFNSVFSFLFILPYLKKEMEELGKELLSISGERSPDICLVLLLFEVLDVFLVLVMVWCFFKVILQQTFSPSSQRVSKQGRLIPFLRGISYSLLPVFWIMQTGMARSTVLFWPNTSSRGRLGGGCVCVWWKEFLFFPFLNAFLFIRFLR